MANTMLSDVKLALRVSISAFDGEIQALINDCISELTMLGIYDEELTGDDQIISTVIFYCKARFGDNPESEKWEKIYRDKLEKLLIAKKYGGTAHGQIGSNNPD